MLQSHTESMTWYFEFNQPECKVLSVSHLLNPEIYVTFDPFALIFFYRPPIQSRSNSIIITDFSTFFIRQQFYNVVNCYMHVKCFHPFNNNKKKTENLKDIILRCVVMADRFQYVWIQISNILYKKILISNSRYSFFGWIF